MRPFISIILALVVYMPLASLSEDGGVENGKQVVVRHQDAESILQKGDIFHAECQEKEKSSKQCHFYVKLAPNKVQADDGFDLKGIWHCMFTTFWSAELGVLISCRTHWPQ